MCFCDTLIIHHENVYTYNTYHFIYAEYIVALKDNTGRVREAHTIVQGNFWKMRKFNAYVKSRITITT